MTAADSLTPLKFARLACLFMLQSVFMHQGHTAFKDTELTASQSCLPISYSSLVALATLDPWAITLVSPGLDLYFHSVLHA